MDAPYHSTSRRHLTGRCRERDPSHRVGARTSAGRGVVASGPGSGRGPRNGVLRPWGEAISPRCRGSVAGGAAAMTRVVVVRKTGGPDVLELDRVELPPPGPGQARV